MEKRDLKKPHLFELWDKILGKNESENQKNEAGKEGWIYGK